MRRLLFHPCHSWRDGPKLRTTSTSIIRSWLLLLSFVRILATDTTSTATRTTRSTSSSSAMQCRVTKDKVICEIPHEAVAAMDGGDWRGEHCMDDEEICIQTTITNKKKSHNLPLKSEDGDDDDDNNNNNNNNNNEIISSAVRVGSFVYNEPYRQYGRDVAALLRDRPTNRIQQQHHHHHHHNNNYPLEMDLALMHWYSQLGVAHRDRAQQQQPPPSRQQQLSQQQLYSPKSLDGEASLEAFRQVVVSYERIQAQLGEGADKIQTMRDDVRISVANAYSYIAEVHQNDGELTSALHHLRLAERMYRDVLSDHGRSSGSSSSGSIMALDVRDAVELNLAETCVRAGVLLMDDGLDMSLLTQVDNDHDNEGGKSYSTTTTTTTTTVITQDWSEVMKNMQDAERMFSDAVPLFRKQLSSVGMHNPDHSLLQVQLANALQHQGSALMFLAKLPRALEVWEEALSIYRHVFPLLIRGSVEEADVKVSMGEILYSLSDVQLQRGQYDASQQYYKESMEWYEQHKIQMPAVQVSILDSDETLSVHETAMEEYHASLNGGGSDILMPGQEEGVYYEPDDLYEADLHATLGAIRLSRDEMQLAMHHFSTAIDLYEGYEGEERALADVKLNLATALLRRGEHKESAKVHGEALELYRKSVGEGKNPLAAGLEEFGVKDESNSDSESEEQGDSDENIVHDRLINIDEYRQSVMNMTTSSSKEEL